MNSPSNRDGFSTTAVMMVLFPEPFGPAKNNSANGCFRYFFCQAALMDLASAFFSCQPNDFRLFRHDSGRGVIRFR
jgi:hypothetical protein